MADLDERERLIAQLLGQLETLRQHLTVLAAPVSVSIPPEAQPKPGLPFVRYRWKDGSYTDLDAMWEVHNARRQLASILAAEIPDAERGRRFGKDKPPRRRSRLYREAADVLGRDGIKTPAQAVMRELEARGVVTIKNKKVALREMVLLWDDDERRSQRTTFIQFAKQVSNLRGELAD